MLHIFYCLMRLIIFPVLFITFLGMSAGTWAQPVAADSTFSRYDSIQDRRMEQIRQEARYRLDQLRDDQDALLGAVDSLLEVQDSLGELLVRLDRENRELSGQWMLLRENADRAAEASADYRQRLHRTLWLSGVLMLLLILGLAAYLFSRSIRIRDFLQRQITSVRDEAEKIAGSMQRKQKKLRKQVRRDMQIRGDRIEKKIRKEVRRRRKK